MNILKSWFLPKKAAPPASQPQIETEEIPTMILDGEKFYTYRRFRTTAQQATPPLVHLLPTR